MELLNVVLVAILALLLIEFLSFDARSLFGEELPYYYRFMIRVILLVSSALSIPGVEIFAAHVRQKLSTKKMITRHYFEIFLGIIDAHRDLLTDLSLRVFLTVLLFSIAVPLFKLALYPNQNMRIYLSFCVREWVKDTSLFIGMFAAISIVITTPPPPGPTHRCIGFLPSIFLPILIIALIPVIHRKFTPRFFYFQYIPHFMRAQE